jgi:tetratricopeptide (TPR) repeat protein
MDGPTRAWNRLYFFCVLLTAFAASWVYGEVPDELEPEYSEAVLAYNEKEYSKAHKILGELIKKAPSVTEFLELKALALKAEKKTAESVGVYEKLIAAKMAKGAKEKDVAPYHFELGVIKFGEKNLAASRKHLEIAARHDFNRGPTNLYLGMDAFQRGAWGEAENYFDQVISSNTRELWAASAFYMAQSQVKADYRGGAAYNLARSKSYAQAVIDDPNSNPDAKKIAQQIYESADKALKPFEKTTYFAQVGSLFGWDTNPLTAQGDPASGESTGKWSLFGGAGLATSPIGFLQLVPTLRFAGNLNTNSQAQATEFFNPGVSIAVNRTPLSRFSWGVKADLMGSFRNSAASSGRFLFTPFSTMISAGANMKAEIAKKLNFGVEFAFEPQRFFIDLTTTFENYRSGLGYSGRVYVANDAGRRFFNPRAGVRAYYNDTTGTEFGNLTGTVEFGNVFRPIANLNINLALEGSYWSYLRRTAGYRGDWMFLGVLNTSYKVWKGLSALLNFDITINQSGPGGSNALFTYNRMNLGGGLSYSF